MAAAGRWASGGRLGLIRGNISTRLWRTTRSWWRLSRGTNPLELRAARLLTVVRLPGVDHRDFTHRGGYPFGVCSPQFMLHGYDTLETLRGSVGA